jgi:hemerythrin-like domain-containing protein
MSTDFPGFSGPGASTEAPLEMLAACHVRIERQCSTLKRLAEYLPDHGSDTQARQAARSVMRYFDTSAIQHHADEEEDLFPALIESMAGSDAVCIRAMVSGLSADHRELESRWRILRDTLIRIESGESAALSGEDVDAFTSLYQQHIQREEDELLPMAGRLLGDADIQRIGQAMRRRRGIDDNML